MRVHGRTERRSRTTFDESRFRMPIVSGGYIEKAIPDPIPNSEVKLLGADGTARATVWESRTLPGYFSKGLETPRGLLPFCSCKAASSDLEAVGVLLVRGRLETPRGVLPFC